MATVHGAAASQLDGTWEGAAGDGSTIVWQVDASRVRIDGRPADLEIRADTLVVRFDAPLQAGPDVARETAVYRFLFGAAQHGPARLFVYGFDLGTQGLYLVRTSQPPPPPEDVAPPVPSNDGHTRRSARSSPVPGPQARSNEH